MTVTESFSCVVVGASMKELRREAFAALQAYVSPPGGLLPPQWDVQVDGRPLVVRGDGSVTLYEGHATATRRRR